MNTRVEYQIQNSRWTDRRDEWDSRGEPEKDLTTARNERVRVARDCGFELDAVRILKRTIIEEVVE